MFDLLIIIGFVAFIAWIVKKVRADQSYGGRTDVDPSRQADPWAISAILSLTLRSVFVCRIHSQLER